MLTDFRLKELRQLAEILGSHPYLDPQTGEQVHALEDTTVAALMKSSAIWYLFVIQLGEWTAQLDRMKQFTEILLPQNQNTKPYRSYGVKNRIH